MSLFHAVEDHETHLGKMLSGDHKTPHANEIKSYFEYEVPWIPPPEGMGLTSRILKN